MKEFPWGSLVGVVTQVYPGGLGVVLTVRDEAGYSEYKTWVPSDTKWERKDVELP